MARADSIYKITPQEIHEFAVKTHDLIPFLVNDDDSDKDGRYDWMLVTIKKFAKKMYDAQPHWHHWTGACIQAVPFEVFVGAAGVLYASWFYDIMLRKARDRKSAFARERTQEYRALLNQTLTRILAEVDKTRDIRAEKEHVERSSPINKKLHDANTKKWGH